MENHTIQDLETLVQPGSSDTAIILLHGFGANFQDLGPLAQVLDKEQRFHWYFPNGFVRVPLSPFYDARAWMMIDLAEYDRAIRAGEFREFANQVPDGFLEASQKVQSFLDDVAKRHSKIILGGFSQGAMASVDVALNTSVDLEKLILLSGTFVAEDRWQSLLKNCSQKFNVFQSHGRSDPVLPFAESERLSETLKEHGHTVSWHPFEGQHEIPPAVLLALKSELGS